MIETKPLLLCGVDFETTGLDFEKDRITEIGAVLWDCATAAPVRLMNVLVRHPDAPPLTPEITALTGLTQAMIDAHGLAPDAAFRALIALMGHAEAVVAHNGSGFDRPMLEAQLRRMGLSADDPAVKANWVDTCMDVPYPPRVTTRKLVHLAAEHGFLNPFAHRAVFDVLTMLTVLSRYDIPAVLASAKLPMKTLVAGFGYADVEARDRAKSRGYRWKPGPKLWVKHVRENAVAEEQAACGFRLSVREFDPGLNN